MECEEKIRRWLFHKKATLMRTNPCAKDDQKRRQGNEKVKISSPFSYPQFQTVPFWAAEGGG